MNWPIQAPAKIAREVQNSGQGTGPWGYTLGAAELLRPVTVTDSWVPTGGSQYDLSVYGPNGFFRRFAGGLAASSANLGIETAKPGFAMMDLDLFLDLGIGPRHERNVVEGQGALGILVGAEQ